MVEFNALLVPVDFSPAARSVFEEALGLVSGPDPSIIVHHVIDENLVEFALDHGLADEREIGEGVRERAERLLDDYRVSDDDPVSVETLVTRGLPFLEIIRKAEEFQVDAILMGKFGARGRVEKALFGTTAEKVLRWASCPVVVMP